LSIIQVKVGLEILLDPAVIFSTNTIVDLDMPYGFVTKQISKHFLFSDFLTPNRTIDQSAVFVILNTATGDFLIDRTSSLYSALALQRTSLRQMRHSTTELQHLYAFTAECFFHVGIIYVADPEEARLIEMGIVIDLENKRGYIRRRYKLL
jgi:hypothetical protein